MTLTLFQSRQEPERGNFPTCPIQILSSRPLSWACFDKVSFQFMATDPDADRMGTA